MRIRETNNPPSTISSVNDITWGPASAWIGAGIAPSTDPRDRGPFVGFYSGIADVEHGRKGDNPCIHYEVEISADALSTGVGASLNHYNSTTHEWESVFSGTFRTLGPNHYSAFPTGYVSNHHNGVALEHWDVSPNRSGEAVTAMWPEIKAQLSVINSILELKDFKHLPKLLKQTQGSLNSLLSFMKCQGLLAMLKQRKFKKLTLKQLVEVITGQHLNYMFAVAPLVSDLNAIRRVITKADQQINNLLEQEGKDLTSHFSANIPLSQFEKTGDFGGSYWQGSKWYQHKIQTLMPEDAKYTALMRYQYVLPKMLREHARVLGWLDAFGINFNPAIIWNAIPFSFVVDWISNVGKAVDSYKGSLLAPIVSIEGFCHSLSYKLEDEIWIYPYRSQCIAGEADYEWSAAAALWSHRTRRVYVRRTAVPDLFTTIHGAEFSTTEITLAASLLGSIWSGHH